MDLLCRACFMHALQAITRPGKCVFCEGHDGVEKHQIVATANKHTTVDAVVKLFVCKRCIAKAMSHPSAMQVKGDA